jgi:hypothetical protein
MAPNLVTLVGLLFNIGGAIAYLFYDTSMTKYVPAWTHIVAATGGFIY